MIEDGIGLIILVVLAVILLIFAGFCLIFSLDLLTSSVSWFGQGPAIGWALGGGILGAMLGAKQGIRKRGKSDNLRKPYVGAAICVALLLALGAASPAGMSLIGW
jgi:hypothetical protein